MCKMLLSETAWSEIMFKKLEDWVEKKNSFAVAKTHL